MAIKNAPFKTVPKTVQTEWKAKTKFFFPEVQPVFTRSIKTVQTEYNEKSIFHC